VANPAGIPRTRPLRKLLLSAVSDGIKIAIGQRQTNNHEYENSSERFAFETHPQNVSIRNANRGAHGPWERFPLREIGFLQSTRQIQ